MNTPEVTRKVWMAGLIALLVMAGCFWIGSMIYGDSASLREFLHTPLRNATIGDIAILAAFVVILAK